MLELAAFPPHLVSKLSGNFSRQRELGHRLAFDVWWETPWLGGQYSIKGVRELKEVGGGLWRCTEELDCLCENTLTLKRYLSLHGIHPRMP